MPEGNVSWLVIIVKNNKARTLFMLPIQRFLWWWRGGGVGYHHIYVVLSNIIIKFDIKLLLTSPALTASLESAEKEDTFGEEGEKDHD